MCACLQRGAAVAPRGLVNVEPRVVLTYGGVPGETTGESRSERDIITNMCKPRTTFYSGRPQRLTVKLFKLEEVPPNVAWLRGQFRPHCKGCKVCRRSDGIDRSATAHANRHTECLGALVHGALHFPAHTGGSVDKGDTTPTVRVKPPKLVSANLQGDPMACVPKDVGHLPNRTVQI